MSCRCARYFNDPLVAQKMAEDVLATLTEEVSRWMGRS